MHPALWTVDNSVPSYADDGMPASIRHRALPGADGHRLYLVEFDPAQFVPSAFAAAGIACPDTIARSVPKRQAEFFHGRSAARLALMQLGHTALTQVGIGAVRQPLWPEGIIGSITHAGPYAAAIALPASPRHGIGIDIEMIADGSTLEALRATAMDAEEAAVLQAAVCDQWSYPALATALFSAKESLFKAAHASVGRFFGFEAARCRRWDARSGSLHLQLTQTLCAGFSQGDTCQISVSRLERTAVFTSYLW